MKKVVRKAHFGIHSFNLGELIHNNVNLCSAYVKYIKLKLLKYGHPLY